MRSRLAKTLRYVISQQLIPRKSGGRVAVLEVFKNTPRTAHYLDCEDPAGANLLDAIKNGTSEGMHAASTRKSKNWSAQESWTRKSD